jgi:catechol 2,3-dioxygenase-like lactoylglutathione lyase family enzyme
MDRVHLHVMALDCPDPLALAGFYSAITGLPVEPLGDFPPDKVTWIELLNSGMPTLGFQKVDDYRAPTWPTGPQPQQAHLDFHVDDLDAGERFVVALGARRAEFQPGDTFRVFLDPAGHPFCLVVPSAD